MTDMGFANVEVLSAANTKVLAINYTRVSRGKGYGLMTPIATFDVAVSDILDALDVQPVKRGRWVQYNRNGEETYIECTNCCVPSRPRHLQMVTRTGEGLPDYCPNCGARMGDDTNG